MLERLAGLGPLGLLASLALALSDYQLGAGGATRYWSEAADLLDKVDLKTIYDVRNFMTLLMLRPVAARLRARKMARMDKFFASKVPNLLDTKTVEELGQQPFALWHEIASGMGQPPHDKTVAFGMKVFDMVHFIATGRYAKFGSDVPIVADLRIARVSLSSGLLRPADGTPVRNAMAAVSGTEAPDQELVRVMWARVAETTHGLSLFRVDSVIWQIEEPIFRLRHDRDSAIAEVRSHMSRYGANAMQAEELAVQFTAAL